MKQKFQYLFLDYFVPRLIVDIVVFFFVLLFLGWMAARIPIDAKFVAGAIANYLMLVFAFVINDIADREEDSNTVFKRQTLIQTLRLVSGTDGESERDEDEGVSYKRFRNPFAFGILTVNQGYIFLTLITTVSIGLSLFVGGKSLFFVTLSNMIVGYMYSMKPFRLKSRFPWDGLSHAYLLAAVVIIYFLSYPFATFDIWSLMILVLAFANSYAGDLRNEYRDFEEDQAAGITNTATYLGKRNTLYVSTFLYVLSALSFIAGVLGAFLSNLS